MNSRYKENLSELESKLQIDLLHGSCGAALFYLHQYQVSQNKLILMKGIKQIQKSLAGISSLFRETSFHAGPLGILWVSYLFENVSGVNVVKPEVRDSVIDQYLEFQIDQDLQRDSGLLDFLYGVSGWFVIYPYLNKQQQERITEYYALVVDGNLVDFIDEVDLLGIAHGLSSVMYIVNAYNINLSDKKRQLLKETLMKGVNNSFELSRYSRKNDYGRQDWCHGHLGLALNGLHTEEVLANYSSQPFNPRCHGVCHGLAQRVLLSKIGPAVFSQEFTYKEFPQMDFDNPNVNNSLIESYLIAKMAIEMDISRDYQFSWWRLCYPTPFVELS